MANFTDVKQESIDAIADMIDKLLQRDFYWEDFTDDEKKWLDFYVNSDDNIIMIEVYPEKQYLRAKKLIKSVIEYRKAESINAAEIEERKSELTIPFELLNELTKVKEGVHDSLVELIETCGESDELGQAIANEVSEGLLEALGIDDDEEGD